MPSSSYRPDQQPAKRKHYLVDGSDSELNSDESYNEPYVRSDDSEATSNIQPRRQTKKSSSRKVSTGEVSDFVSQKLARYRIIYEQLMKANSTRSDQKSTINSFNQLERQTVLSVHQIHNYKTIIAADQRSIILKLVNQSALIPPTSNKIKNSLGRGNPRPSRSSPTNKTSKSSNEQPNKRPSKSTRESESESDEVIEQSDSEDEYEPSSESDHEGLYINQLFDQSINQSPVGKKRKKSSFTFRPTVEKISLYRTEIYPRLRTFRLNNQLDNRSNRRSSNQSNQQGIDRLQSEFTTNSLKIVCSVNQIRGYSDLRYRELAALVFSYLMDDRLMNPSHYNDDQILNYSQKVISFNHSNHSDESDYSDHSDQSDQFNQSGHSASDFDEQPLIQLVKGSNNQSIDASNDSHKSFDQLNAEYSLIYRKILALDWHHLTEQRLSQCVNQSELIAVSRIHGFDVSNVARAQLLTQVFQLIDENIIVRPPELSSQHRSVRY